MLNPATQCQPRHLPSANSFEVSMPVICFPPIVLPTGLIYQTACLLNKHFWLINNRACKKWNESGFRPPLCTYRLNWARRTSWGWWDDWDDTVLQTQDSKFEPWRSEAEHATSRSRRLPTILTFTRGWGRNNFVYFKPPRPGTEPRTLAWKAAVLTTTLGPPPNRACTLVHCTHTAVGTARRSHFRESVTEIKHWVGGGGGN